MSSYVYFSSSSFFFLRPFVRWCGQHLGQVYRALNYLQGDNESVSSVSSDGFADQAPFISTTSHPQQQQQQSNASASVATQPHQTPSSSSSTSTRSNSQPPPQASSDNNLASRRDDDGNVEFDFD